MLKASGLVIVPFVGEGDELVGEISHRTVVASSRHRQCLAALADASCRKDPTFAGAWREIRCDTPAIEARSAMSVGKMARVIQMLLSDAIIVVGLWSLPPEGGARLVRKIKESLLCTVYTNLDEAVQGIASLIIPGRVEARTESERSQEAKHSRIREV